MPFAGRPIPRDRVAVRVGGPRHRPVHWSVCGWGGLVGDKRHLL